MKSNLAQKFYRYSAIMEKLFGWYLAIFCHDADKKLERSYFHEICRYWQLIRKYNATNETDDDIVKMQFTILRENHVIEKGMSMLNPRKGFGQEKVSALILRLSKYVSLYGEKDRFFLEYPMNTVQSYIEYTKENGVEIPAIEHAFRELIEQSRINPTHEIEAGLGYMTREEFLKMCDGGFESLLYSRHSLRYFSKDEVEKEKIVKALNLAQRTPSACNRQGWRTHVFRGDESVRLMYWQEGCRGCEDGFSQSILVTADLKAFLSHEVFQVYIDGALYAMNLVNALHSLGIGTIPLSCGFSYDKLQYLDQFGIPENEVPILIIAFGNVEDEFHYAKSTRRSIDRTNTFHYK